MTNQLARRIVLAARPIGAPGPSDFRLEEFPVPVPGAGEILLGIKYLSLDPYMRGRMNAGKSYVPPTGIGDVMVGATVAVVLQSNHADYSPGDFVASYNGWQTHAVSDGAGLRKLDPDDAPVTTSLGVLGMPGLTAYGGLYTIGRPQPGETVVVAAASGSVGSLVGQLAQIAGARAVGIAGGTEKCAFVKDVLRMDAAIDHRSNEFAKELADACPGGIDVYFENVGGAVWRAVLPLLNKFARVPVCGLIAHYNGGGKSTEGDMLPATMGQILTMSLTLRGFIVTEFADQQARFLADVGKWIREGRIRYKEDIVDGLERAPEAFMGMLTGGNFGKLIVRVST